CGFSLRDESALAEINPPRPMYVIAASEPPVTMTSASPSWMQRSASAMASAADAHAVETARLGPHRPKWIETLPAAALGIIFGMTNGLMPRGPPPSMNLVC